jgi:hypothetical protein
MTAATLAPVKATPLAEVPAAALRIAAGFASLTDPDLACVGIRPGDGDDQVIVSAASPAKAVELRTTGRCQRHVSLPIRALQSALRRHGDAEHAVVADADDGLISLRTFSESTTVSVSMPESSGAALNLPEAVPGAFQVEPLLFSPGLLISTLRDLQAAGSVQIQPFGFGWILRGEAETYTVKAFVAGMRSQ